VRVIEDTVTGEDGQESEHFRLVTTTLDPQDADAPELAAADQQRWEYEISLKDIETHLLASGSGLRSKTPEMVRQEWWGLLLAHYAIRALMVEAADTTDLDPDRLSFLRTPNLVRRHVTNQRRFPPKHSNTHTQKQPPR
jgi:IS4 transposase